nr:hypothetical protein [Tanacetum cinerariifolium]
MILESAENGPLIWPFIEENRVTRPKKYSELSATKAIQDDCVVKETNIILQGLLPEVYALVSNHKVAKELWERIQLLVQRTSLTKQRSVTFMMNSISLLIRRGNITLPPEWSKFMTDVKLVRDLHTTNVDQLYAYLGQYEFHANEVRLMHERNSDPLALVATHQMTQSPYQTHQHSYHVTPPNLYIAAKYNIGVLLHNTCSRVAIDPHHLNAWSDLIESLLNQDSSSISSSKIDSPLDEFAGELILLKSIPLGIDEADFLMLQSNLCLHLLSTLRIVTLLWKRSIYLLIRMTRCHRALRMLTNSEGDMLILEEFLSNDSLLLLENESFHFDIPLSPRPPAKPPDDDEIKPNSGIFTIKVMGDISEQYVPMPRLLPNQPTLASNQEKSPHLLSHRGLKAF